VSGELSRRSVLAGSLSAAALAPAAAPASSGTPAAAVQLRPRLTAAAAQRIALACRQQAEQHGSRVSIAVVDDAGVLLHFERLEGALPVTAGAAVGKAQTSAALQVPSGTVAELAREMPALLLQPGMAVRGAVPLMWQGTCVGAVGVSGLEAAQDEQLAIAGAAALA